MFYSHVCVCVCVAAEEAAFVLALNSCWLEQEKDGEENQCSQQSGGMRTFICTRTCNCAYVYGAIQLRFVMLCQCHISIVNES